MLFTIGVVLLIGFLLGVIACIDDDVQSQSEREREMWALYDESLAKMRHQYDVAREAYIRAAAELDAKRANDRNIAVRMSQAS